MFIVTAFRNTDTQKEQNKTTSSFHKINSDSNDVVYITLYISHNHTAIKIIKCKKKEAMYCKISKQKINKNHQISISDGTCTRRAIKTNTQH